MLWLFCAVVGYVMLGVGSFGIAKQLQALYPRSSEFWWAKFVPLFGFAFALLAAEEPIYFAFPGMFIVLGSGIWMHVAQQRRIH